MADTLKQVLRRRLEGAKVHRRPFEAEIREIASYTAPAKSRFLSTAKDKGRQPNRRLYNSHGIVSFRTLQGGMHSGLSSQSRPWFTLKVQDELNDQPDVRIWLGECERILYAFLAHTNFYEAAKSNYLEIGAFGTAATVGIEHRDAGMVCHAQTFGEYWIVLNDQMRPGGLYRDCSLTALQAIGMFGLNNVHSRIRRAYDSSNYEDVFQFYQAIEENDDYVEDRLGPTGKPWRSVYWDDGDSSLNDGIVQQLGFNEQPFWAPRWDTTGGDTYGTGPGHDALPDLRELQLQSKRKAEATDFHIHPEIVAAGKVKLKRQPKSVVNVGTVDDVSKLVDVPYQVPYEAIQTIKDDVVRLEEKVNQASFAELFMAITNMQGIQPRNIEEIASRNEEKLTQLGPVIERVNGEMLEVSINRSFAICQRMQMFPPAPEALHNQEIKIEFVSILTQMQRMVGLGQIERASNYVGSIAAVYPEARHKLNPFALVDEYWDRAGAPAKLLRSDEDAQADADAENQAAQAAAAAEQAPNISKPFKDMTDAAKVASTIPGSGTPPVEDLVPVVPR